MGRNYTWDQRRLLQNTLVDVFNCRLEALPLNVYSHMFMTSPHWRKSAKMEPYRDCIGSDPKLVPGRISKCLPLLVSACLNSPIRVVKVIRLRMDLVGDLVRWIPNLRVIHYTRDPRAILYSRWSTTRKKIYKDWETRAVCTKMAFDLDTRVKLSSNHRSSFLQVRYEDLVSNPDVETRRMYEFIDVDQSETSKWLLWAMHAHSDDGLTGTRRKDARKVAVKWKERLSTVDKLTINQTCHTLVHTLGYS